MKALLAALLVLGVSASPRAAPQPAGPSTVGRMTVEAPGSLQPAADRLRRVDLSGLARDLSAAGLAFPPRIRVELIPESDARARYMPTWIVGLATSDSDMVIFPERVLPYPYDSIESVFRHEVTHLALTVQAGDRPLPRWFHEGLAISVDTGWGTRGQVRLLLAMTADPGTAALSRLFAAGTESEASEAYGLSAALVTDLRRRHGTRVPGAIADRVREGVPFDEAFRLETGETPDQAATLAWSGYRRWISWVPAATSTTAIWGAILALAFLAFLVRGRQRARRRQQWDDESTFDD